MKQRGDDGIRGLLGFDPLALLVDSVIWKLRWAGRRLLTGLLLLVGLAVMAAAFFVPLILAGAVIAVFGLAVEPYKWLGTVLIVVSFAIGLVSAPLLLRRVIRRGRRVIALTEFADDGDAAHSTGPSPIVAAGPTREAWTAGIRAMDARLGAAPAKPADRATELKPPGDLP